MRSRLAALPRSVWILGLISLVNDGASDLIDPLLPLYLTSVLMAGPRALVLIEGIAVALMWLRLVDGAPFSGRDPLGAVVLLGGMGILMGKSTQ